MAKRKYCVEHGEHDLSRHNCSVCGVELKSEVVDMVFRHAGKKLTGITSLRGAHQKVPAVICGSGPSLVDFDPSIVPDDWVVVAVNEAIRKIGRRADYWVLSDRPIVREYSKQCPTSVTILAMHEATLYIDSAKPKNEVYTVDSRMHPEDFSDGYQFFSRGTVLIGAIEMLRYMGVRRFFCFGLDCYRTRDQYYYDGRKPQKPSETKILPNEVVWISRSEQVWVTSRLRHMIDKLNMARKSGLWDRVEIFCVNSPLSQQTAIEKIDLEAFEDYKRKHADSKKRSERRRRARLARAQATEESVPGSDDENPVGDPEGGGARVGDNEGSPDSSLDPLEGGDGARPGE